MSWSFLPVRFLRRYSILALALAAVTTANLAGGQSAGPSAPRPIRTYAIPAQPLLDAIEAFSEASGVQVIYDADLARGIRSQGVQGTRTPEEAIRQILAGTSLEATFVRSNTVYIYSTRRAEASGGPGAVGVTGVMALGVLHVDAPAPRIGQPRFDGYAAMLQFGIREALERKSETRKGDWSALAELNLDREGQVSRARLISSTGERQIDGAILDVLETVRLPPPPSGLPQPIRLQIHAAGASQKPESSCKAQSRRCGQDADTPASRPNRE